MFCDCFGALRRFSCTAQSGKKSHHVVSLKSCLLSISYKQTIDRHSFRVKAVLSIASESIFLGYDLTIRTNTIMIRYRSQSILKRTQSCQILHRRFPILRFGDRNPTFDRLRRENRQGTACLQWKTLCTVHLILLSLPIYLFHHQGFSS